MAKKSSDKPGSSIVVDGQTWKLSPGGHWRNTVTGAASSIKPTSASVGSTGQGNAPLPVSNSDKALDKSTQTLYSDKSIANKVKAGGNLSDFIFDESKAPQLNTKMTDLDNEILSQIRGNLSPSADDQKLHDMYFGDRLNGLTPQEMTQITEQGRTGLDQSVSQAMRQIISSGLANHLQGGAAIAPAMALQRDKQNALQNYLQGIAVQNIGIKDQRLNEASNFNSYENQKQAYWTNALAQTGTGLEARYDSNNYINNQVLQAYRAGQVGGRISAGNLGQTQADTKKWFDLQQQAIDKAAAMQVPEISLPNFGAPPTSGFETPGGSSTPSATTPPGQVPLPQTRTPASTGPSGGGGFSNPWANM